jgi:hypothetical protein
MLVTKDDSESGQTPQTVLPIICLRIKKKKPKNKIKKNGKKETEKKCGSVRRQESGS